MEGAYKFPESTKKLYLVPLDNKRASLVVGDTVSVTISKKYGLMNIGKKSLEAMNMGNAWYKLAFDANNNVVAWRVRHELSNEHLQELGWRFCKPDPEGQAIISIKRILDAIPGLTQESYRRLEVKKYKDKDLAGEGDFYYYVEVKNDLK